MQADRVPHGDKPRIGLTLGDINGIGPEVVIGAILDTRVQAACHPIVIGAPTVLERGFRLFGAGETVRVLDSPAAAHLSGIDCWQPDVETPDVAACTISAAAGRFAGDCLLAAIRAARDGLIHGICTAPLNKAALAAAGIRFPGHTEILAHACDVDDYAMMLHLSAEALAGMRELIGGTDHDHGLAIAHVTLHTSIRSVPDLLTTDSILEKTQLVNRFLQRIGIHRPQIAVAALNPHGGEDGLFGTEETAIIAPAVRAAQSDGIAVSGPFPTDTLIRRAILGEFHGIVAMYHDQGHIPVKLIGFDQAVNVTLGIPMIRTSPTHGTAFDIAWQGVANPAGMIEAILLAAQLAQTENAT